MHEEYTLYVHSYKCSEPINITSQAAHTSNTRGVAHLLNQMQEVKWHGSSRAMQALRGSN